MALKTVTGKLTGPNNAAVPGALVQASLSAAAIIAATQEIAPVAVTTLTAADGTWSLSLEANLDLTPNTTYYTVTAGGWNCTAVVPQTAGPFVIENIMAAPPPTQSAGVDLASAQVITGVKSVTEAFRTLNRPVDVTHPTY